MKTKARKRFTDQFKSDAVELALIREGSKTVADIACELGIESSCLYRWIKDEQAGSQSGSEGGRAAGESSAADELARLRKENHNLKRDNLILKKAAIILGTESTASNRPNNAK